MSEASKGLLADTMSKWFGPSWWTSLLGFGGFACSVVVVVDQVVAHPLLHTAAGICTAAGLGLAGAIGVGAKGKNVTGLPP